MFPLHRCYTFYNCSTVLTYSVLFFSVSVPCFSVSKDSIEMSQAQRFFPQPCSVYQWAHQRHSSLLLQCFALFFRISLSLLTLSICSCVWSTLYKRVFSVLIIVVVLNSWCDRYNIPAMSGFHACSVSSNCFLFLLFGMFYNYFLVARHAVPGKGNCCKQAFSDVMVSCVGRWTILQSCD